MTPDRFAKVREFFDLVVDLPEADREGVLRAETDDQAIIVEVLALCRSTDKGSTTQFSRPLNAMLKGAAAPKLHAGDMLGVWKIDREIGQGGMGSVFLVERSDGHFTQTAALKFVKGLPRTDTLAYFSRERQLLATLTHPNIARLLDGGATEDGQPYLVMEYVDGVAIDEFCRQRKLDTAQILKLFSTACDAVAFAHRQLIVHCDLKPSNLLINRDGRPVLLDFGIARLIDRVGAQANDAAIGSSVAYTPRYASPEQREHGFVSTVSDIYSLGIMLGELLGKDISPELVAILAKATAHDPANRYATVDALTSDIERFLKKMPLAAMPATPGYVSGKFLQRRWPMVLIGAVFAATVVGFTIRVLNESQRAQSAEKVALSERDRAQVAEQQAVKERDATQAARAEAVQERDGAARERDRATSAEQVAAQQRNAARTAEKSAIDDRDRAKAAEGQAVTEKNKAARAEVETRKTNEFLVSIFEDSNPSADAGDVPASKLIAAAEARLEKELKDQPTVQADLYAVLGEVQQNMGDNKKAGENYRRAIAMERKNNRPLVLARILRRAAWQDVLRFGGKEAPAMLAEALVLAEKFAPADSEDIAQSLTLIGASKIRPEEGEPLLLRGLAIRMKIAPESDGVGESLIFLGHNARSLRKAPEAIDYYRRALAMSEKLRGADHPTAINILDGLAKALQLQQRNDEAEAMMRRIIATREKLNGPDNERTMRAVMTLGLFLAEIGRPRDALVADRRALDIGEKSGSRDSVNYAVTYHNLALVLSELGRDDEALAAMRETARLGVKVWAPTHRYGARVERNLGRMLRDAGQLEEGCRHLQNAYDRNRTIFGEGDTEVATVMIDLAICSVQAGKLDEARARLKSLDEEQRKLGPDAQAVLARANGLIAEKTGKPDDALAAYRRLEKLMQDKHGAMDARSALASLPRAVLLASRNRGDDRAQSRELAARILAATKEVLDPSAPVLVQLKQMAAP